MKQHTTCFGYFVAGMLCMVMLTPSAVLGAAKTWVPATGGAWTTAGNWSPSGVPSTGDDVTISSDQSAQITDVPTISLASLTVNGNASLVAAANGNMLTVTGSLVVASGKTLSLGDNASGRLECTLGAAATGTISGTVTLFSDATARTFTNNGDLAIAGAGLINGTGSDFVLAANATLRIGSADGITTVGTASGNIQTTNARTFNAGAHYVYNGTVNQNTGTGLPSSLTGSLTVNNSGNTVTLSAARTIADGGSLILTAGTFAAGTNLTMATTSAITRGEGSLTGTLQGTGAYNVTYTGITKVTGVELAGTGLANVTVNLTSGEDLTLGAAATINGNLTIGTGATFEAGTFSHQLKGNLVNNGFFAASTGTTTLNGSAAQTLSGTSVTFNNLTVDNAAGITISSDETVNATLTLTSGNITTGANALIVGPSGTVSRTSGHVVGNLRLNFATGNVAATTFHIGTSAAYTPATLDIDGEGGTAGTITASTTGAVHPDIANSGVDAAKDVERYWTLTAGTAALGGRTYKLEVDFLSGDVPGGASTGAFIFSRKDGTSGVWTEPTGGTYTRTGTSTQYSNFTSLSDFVVGELRTYSISGTILNGAAGVSGVVVSASGGFTGSGTTNASGVYTIPGVPRNASGITLTPALTGYTFLPTTLNVAGPVAADVTGQDFAATDVAAPTVTTYSPLDNATGVAVSTNLVLTFSENIVKGTGNIEIRRSSDNVVFETIDVTTALVAVTGNQATINPAGMLAGVTGYYVNIAATAFKDGSNNAYAGIANTTTWNFTTSAARTIFYVSTTGNDITGDGSLALPFKTIGKGVSTAVAKDTVAVLEGTYVETVNIDKSLALLAWGPGVKTILAPAGFESTSPTAYEYAVTGCVRERALVHIGTTTPIRVLMRGFTVDVNTLGPPHAAAIAYGGILAEKCTVTVVQNVVRNVLPADGVSIRHPGLLYNGRGIEVRGSGAVAVIDSNTIQEVNRFHILVNATDSTSLLPAVFPQALVRYNTVIGKGSAHAAGQKGVWFGHGAYGIISRNTISNLDYPSPDIEPDRSTGIVIWRGDFNLSAVSSVLENTLTASTFINNKGVYAWGLRDTIRSNVITGFRWGIELHNERNPSVTRNTITGGAIGIMLGDERIVGLQNAQITIGGSLGNKNVITGQISPASGGRAITLAYRDPLNTEELKSPYPVVATYNDFGVYTAAEISERIFDRADTTLANIDTVLFTPFMVPKTTLALKVYLQGPYTTVGDSMRSILMKGGHLTAHFTGAQIPSRGIDSVTIQVRDSLTTGTSTKVYTVPAWLLTNGTLRTFSDTTKSYVEFPDTVSGNYYVVVRHRNHLAIMSAVRVACEGSTASLAYDFTTASNKAYGTDPMMALGTGGIAPYGLYGGDADGDGQVVSSDFNVFNPRFVSGATGYQASDWNLDGQVTSTDFNLFNANFTAGKVTRVP